MKRSRIEERERDGDGGRRDRREGGEGGGENGGERKYGVK